ncbi:ThiF family adenylyltransferase, partial [Micromonospora sp. NPDC005313]|uniref:ThiF family adenylyltransferase n=1 Tax=Micromonospora sp. NPDC005313 TaxID=3154296 RepID=UPI0033A97233
VLLRFPALSADLRVIEPETLALSNLNRYALGRRSSVEHPKTDMLRAFTRPDIRISAVAARLDSTTAQTLASLAPRVLVGVDHIPSRWVAQQAAPESWLCVGASSHDFVLVSSHPPGSACAGCAHPRDDETAEEIPTISFVSFWAGLIQALELIAHAARTPTGPTAAQVWPFGLDNPRGIHRAQQMATPRCPVGCTAARTLPRVA